ncbi:hypothetical protein FDP41_001196 [Naegleria fowleri]|uniref:F-box domain-containing protein n=1 Tax=Naegleria fowleri TaxID=5763 RepID=A0A6A5BPT2_NAEFO|nr:uncharacterized protein FDP41_001196 [Naegleria fowleri]KAF0980043.1 hypothetical protein FDP41_001196 [Naegleria fowleri]
MIISQQPSSLSFDHTVNIFIALPPEMILQIFEFCSGMDLLQLYHTSANLRKEFMMESLGKDDLNEDSNHLHETQTMNAVYKKELMKKILPSRSYYHQAVLMISPPGNLIFKLAYYELLKERAERSCQINHEEPTTTTTTNCNTLSGLNLPSFEANISFMNGLGYKSVKIACVGPAKCGKTQYVNCVTGQSPFDNEKQGVGAFVRNLKVYFHSYMFQLEIWDIARSKGMERIFMAHSDFVMFCFDLNNEQSFFEMCKMIEEWMIDRFASFRTCELNDHLHENRMYVCIIGMKNDLSRKVSNETILQWLNSFNLEDYTKSTSMRGLRIQYFELSTKNNRRMYLPLFHMLRAMENDIA